MLLITGSKGQLGTSLSSLLKEEAILADVDMLDITDASAVLEFVKKNNIDTIINCSGYTAVDKAEDEPEKARLINVIGPLNLAKTRVKLVHISTDYVFDGLNHKPYNETDKTIPNTVYGKTKLEGEEKVLSHAKTAIIIRTSWLYSPHGNNFVKTMIKLGAEKQTLNVIFDQIGTPTNAFDLSKVIIEILPLIKEGTKEIYNFSNEGVCSWYDFATEIMELSKLACKVFPIESKDYPVKATRPFYSVLNKAKIKKDFNINIPHWKESLKECLKQF